MLLVAWGVLVRIAWRRGRPLEALGLGWIGIAYLPVANFLFPVGIFVAERTLYLPLAGLALAVGAYLQNLPRRFLAVILGTVLLLCGVRTALRVPSGSTFGTRKQEMPFVPAGASGTRARTRWTI